MSVSQALQSRHKFGSTLVEQNIPHRHHPDVVDKDKRRSPRRLERYPIYVLNVTLPSEDVDASYEPRKRILGYRVSDLKHSLEVLTERMVTLCGICC